MAAQTIANLKGIEFTLSGAPGRITPQSAQDLIDTVALRTPVCRVTDPEYGAIGDGSGHAASSKYGTLGALQAVYGTTISGVTVALTQELDWLATQFAINTAHVNGGTVYSPPGTYRYTNANSVADGSGTLTFPIAEDIPPTGSVNWFGDFGGSKHVWSDDLGSGRFAVLCLGRASDSSAGFFEGLWLTGPGGGSTFGSYSSNMQGIGTNDRRAIARCYIESFRVGINVVGGQFLWEDVNTNGCYYGLYFDTPNSANFGNMEFIRVLTGTSYQAAIGVHHAAAVQSSNFLGCFFGTCPYGIFKETNSGSPVQAIVTYETAFDNCQFENIGNALICDDRTTQAARVVCTRDTVFTMTEFSWNASYKITAVGAFSVVDLFQMQGYFKLINPVHLTSWVPGSATMINTFSIGYCQITGDVNTMLSNAVTAGKPMVSTDFSDNGRCLRLENTSGAYWRGGAVLNRDTVGVAGSVVKISAANLQSVVTTGAATDGVLGVLMYNPTPGVAFSTCVYADSGFITVKVSGSVAIGQILRTAASGLAIASGTNPVIGVATTASASGTCEVMLKGLC